MACHSKFVEALGNNAQPYRQIAWWIGKIQQERVSTSDEKRSGRQLSVQTDIAHSVIEQLMYEDTRWTLLELVRANDMEKRSTNVSSYQLYVYCVVFLLHREGHIALYTAVIN
ncbi:uncharacterized protein TNCT_583211 [Trichonephila clavata]|uniref:Uncharacterized protein n=1 Tax=Trichonephila clavata TaxID=2740835 RepID=A0A8X6GMT0_TRICU|nr:uncharacterized protein TNCT_583211 [Trichonephila clavata]